MNISTIDMPQAERVEVSEDTLTAVLSDGRTISVPLKWYPRLAHATAKERRNWRCTGGGIHWPDLNENLSVEALFAGRPAERKAEIRQDKVGGLRRVCIGGRATDGSELGLWDSGTALHPTKDRTIAFRSCAERRHASAGDTACRDQRPRPLQRQ